METRDFRFWQKIFSNVPKLVHACTVFLGTLLNNSFEFRKEKRQSTIYYRSLVTLTIENSDSGSKENKTNPYKIWKTENEKVTEEG